MPSRIVIPRPTVNVKALHRQRRRAFVSPKPVDHVCDDISHSQQEHNPLDEYERRLIKVTSACTPRSSSFFSNSLVVLSLAVLYLSLWSAKSIGRLHDGCRQYRYPSLILAISSVAMGFGCVMFPVGMFIASVAVGFSLKWREAFLRAFHERCQRLEKRLSNHSSSLTENIERYIDMGIRLLEQRTQNFAAPINVSHARQLLQPALDNPEIVTNCNPASIKATADVELGNHVSSSWDIDNSILRLHDDSSQNTWGSHVWLANEPYSKITSIVPTERPPAFKIDFTRSHYDGCSKFDTEGWLLVTNPEMIS